MTSPQSICFSIVSHGQGALIKELLADLKRLNALDPAKDEIVLTLNLPEDESFLAPFSDLPIKIVRNSKRKGFGANHNAAFAVSCADVFLVVNPDIRLIQFDCQRIRQFMAEHEVGLWAPQVLSGTGAVEDSARRFPTVGRLVRRVVFGQRGADYVIGAEPTPVDWVAGMFMALRRETYGSLGGFDERYFMYMEDADICRRVSRMGMKVVLDPCFSVIHEARRASRRNLQHMRWHFRSAARYLLGI